MKLILSACLLALAAAQCTEKLEIDVEQGMRKLLFTGFNPTVNRKSNSGQGNKIVLRGYDRQPIVTEDGQTFLISAGKPCSGGGDSTTGSEASSSSDTDVTTETSAAMKLAGFGLPLLLGGGRSSLLAMTVGTSLIMSPMLVSGQDASDAVTSSECEAVPIEVDIFVDASINEIVMKEYQSGDFETCPPETLYWKHHPDIFGGYEGCVSEGAYWPCATDSQGVTEEEGALAMKYPLNWDPEQEKCIETGYDSSNRTFWVLWGDPSDKYELNLRTGFNPTVVFPFNRGPYPSYDLGADLTMAYDDSADARAMAKDLQLYLEAFTQAELDEFDISMTEGAEQGMIFIWAAKALEIARTTCNRDIYALMGVPAYGYSNDDSAMLANRFSDSFYNSSECLCYADDSCLEPTVTITSVGWLPTTPLPSRVGGDNVTYVANSASEASPWFESMVFPENPSGMLKVPQLPNVNRRVCDGVYLWPMYFGMRDYKIPLDERPDCSAWSFSITKAYSASVRAGFVMYKEEPVTNHDAMVDIMGEEYTMSHGLYSEWSWFGQMQLWEMIMSRPMDDPTSWIGAYSEIMEEKWALIIDGFKDCPVTQVSNPRAGAYAWFVYQPEYIGIQKGFVSSFFRDVLGVRTTTYNWGFRGADPADYYGEGYANEDFTRLQLYRDISVYKEIARRAKIVCNDLDATIGDFISVNQWAAGEGTTERRLTEGYSSLEDRKEHLSDVIPSLSHRQLEYLASSHESTDMIDKAALSCAPHYSTDCLMKKIGNGSRLQDF